MPFHGGLGLVVVIISFSSLVVAVEAAGTGVVLVTVPVVSQSEEPTMGMGRKNNIDDTKCGIILSLCVQFEKGMMEEAFLMMKNRKK